MKVLFVLGGFPEVSESFIINQIAGLIAEGVDVKILAYDIGGHKEAYSGLYSSLNLSQKTFYIENNETLPKRIINFIQFFFKNFLKLKLRHFLNLKILYRFQNIVLEDSFDVIHSHYANIAAKFTEEFYGKPFFNNVKKVCTFHGYDAMPSKISSYKNEYKKLFNYFDLFTCNTPYLKGIVQEINNRIRLVELPVGIDLDFLSENLKTKDKSIEVFTILFCGRLVKLKGIYQLIEIAEQLKLQNINNFRIEIIGDGEEFENLKHLIEEKMLNKNIFLLGRKSQKDVFSYMKKSHIFILPGLYDEKTGRAETQGLVVQEAQFFGLPVIVSDAGGTKYGMIDGKTGFVICEDNIKGYVEKIIFFMNNENQRINFGLNGNRYVCENYSNPVLTEKLIGIYNDIKLNKCF